MVGSKEASVFVLGVHSVAGLMKVWAGLLVHQLHFLVLLVLLFLLLY